MKMENETQGTLCKIHQMIRKNKLRRITLNVESKFVLLLHLLKDSLHFKAKFLKFHNVILF